jgi:NAD(P)-dependent dehydrogenase (short-subunit alcohol dehydrogenase family)
VDYRGKVVVVTGASSGIGYDAAREFARLGGTVVGVARRDPKDLDERLDHRGRTKAPSVS